MKILKYFTKSYEKDIVVYRLRQDKFDEFISKLTIDFRRSYISDKNLTKLSKENLVTKAEFLEKYLLPSVANIISGDFGEIFCFHAVIEKYTSNGIELMGPYKWMWKDRNKPAPYSDVVLYNIANKKKFSKEDLLVSIESKMKATKSSSSRIQDAIDGANEDKLSRLSKTLFWLEEKYAKLGDVGSRKIIERFSNPSKHGQYSTTYKAIALLDKSFEDQELGEDIVNENNIIVVIFSFNELKRIYENLKQNIIDSVK